MKNTIIYLIRHSDTISENGIRNTNENFQIINEKEILSVEGEDKAKVLSEYNELKNIDVIWSSSYTRAKETAKYIAYNNNLSINIDSRLNERKLGNIDELAKFMKNKKTQDPSQEQLIDREFKTSDGESCKDTNKRMTEFLNEILNKYKSKKIVIVSHGGAIKFLLLNWCKVNKKIRLVYKNNTLDITSPCMIKLTFNERQLIGLEQINAKKEKIKATKYIGKELEVKIDRPIGSSHPNYPDHVYLVNYGYIPNTISGDGEELDCYILGEYKPLKEYKGKCIAVIHRLNDDDDKLIIVPENKYFTDNEIRLLTDFQEMYYESLILR